MNNFKNDMSKIQTLVGNSFTSTGSLVALANGASSSPEKLQKTLEQTMASFEKAVLELRNLCEKHSTGVGQYGSKSNLKTETTTGYVEVFGNSWIHIRINSLLPHCRFQSPFWLTDTLKRKLDDYEFDGKQLPYYGKNALMIIDEHSNIEGRKVFDQDNKGWKSVSNALKGKVVPDDDQYSLGVVLISTQSNENVTHITVLDMADASDFFALHSGDYAVKNFYARF